MQSSSVTIAIFRRYGRTIENNTLHFSVYLLARLGASFVLIRLAEMIIFLLLSIESISIYLKVAPEGEVDFIGS